MGSIRDVRGSGEPGLLVICGGGVMDIARGVWYDDEEAGDAAGEE